jgi:Zn-dependent protease
MPEQLLLALYSLPGVIIGLTLHECAHAWVSLKCGDTTARDEGRITLNPLKHIDILGFAFILLAGFGWAKPVHFDRSKLTNPRLSQSLIALAGPFTNLLLGIVFALLFAGFIRLFPWDKSNVILTVVHTVFLYTIYINFGLFVFNLLPIPPLDGSHVVFQTLNLSQKLQEKLFTYGIYGLFIILIIEKRLHVDILPVGKMVRFIADIVLGILGVNA